MSIKKSLSISLLLGALAASPMVAEDNRDGMEAASESWPEGLPKEIPVYGKDAKPEPVQMVPGYYRFNMAAETTDREAIKSALREEAGKLGWSIKHDDAESQLTHLFVFTGKGGELVVKVTSDGETTRQVYYEFLSDEFIEMMKKKKSNK